MKTIRISREVRDDLKHSFSDKSYSRTLSAMAGRFVNRQTAACSNHIERGRDETVPVKVSDDCHKVLTRMKSDVFYDPETVSINDVVRCIL